MKRRSLFLIAIFVAIAASVAIVASGVLSNTSSNGGATKTQSALGVVAQKNSVTSSRPGSINASASALRIKKSSSKKTAQKEAQKKSGKSSSKSVTPKKTADTTTTKSTTKSTPTTAKSAKTSKTVSAQKVLFTYSGTTSMITNSFNVPSGGWSLEYSYTCNPSDSLFDAVIYQGSDIDINDFGAKVANQASGHGSYYYLDYGSFNIHVSDYHCSKWTVTAVTK